jgi:hypothetical protein
MFLNSVRRISSTLPGVWLKYGKHTFKVAIATGDCVADLAERALFKLPKTFEGYDLFDLNAHTAVNGVALSPGTSVASLIANNSESLAIVLKNATKTIYIRNVDENSKMLDSFTETTLTSDLAVKELHQSAQGSRLLLTSDPTVRLTTLDRLQDGGYYQVHPIYTNSQLKT